MTDMSDADRRTIAAVPLITAAQAAAICGCDAGVKDCPAKWVSADNPRYENYMEIDCETQSETDT